MPAEGYMGTTDFETFFRTEHPRLLPVAVALTGALETANDVVQEALIRTWDAWPAVSARRDVAGVEPTVHQHLRIGRPVRGLARSLAIRQAARGGVRPEPVRRI